MQAFSGRFINCTLRKLVRCVATVSGGERPCNLCSLHCSWYAVVVQYTPRELVCS